MGNFKPVIIETKKMKPTLFRDLSKEEEKPFRQWARENYKPMSPISGVSHPVVQDECRKMNEEGERESCRLSFCGLRSLCLSCYLKKRLAQNLRIDDWQRDKLLQLVRDLEGESKE